MDRDDLVLFERSLSDATDRNTGIALDAALDGLGWEDALADDRRAAVSVLFELQGRTGATSSALGQVMAHALGLADGQERTRGAVLPIVGGCEPPGLVVGDRLRVDGLAAAGPVDRPSVLIVASRSGETTAHLVPTASLERRAVLGVDPDLGLLRLTGDVDIGPPGPGVDLAPGAWATAVALGRLAIAHQLVGASMAMLELACEHARARIQFDRPIATFQAVRHRLAETLVAVAQAEAMLDGAWLDPTPDASAMAKAVAGRQAKTAARHCQQVLAGIGFTVEHPFHRYLRRTLVLDALLGTAASLTTALGTELIERRQLPPLLPL
jgi:Acyl-CoA dehydrogenase, C-terminal domain